jgi:hypothetical protein
VLKKVDMPTSPMMRESRRESTGESESAVRTSAREEKTRPFKRRGRAMRLAVPFVFLVLVLGVLCFMAGWWMAAPASLSGFWSV